MKKIVIIGATSAIAEHCARLWVQASPPVQLWLVARDAAKLERVVQDLTARNPSAQVKGLLQADFSDVFQIEQTVAQCCQEAAPDVVLIAHGVLPEQLACQDALALCQHSLMVNAVSPALFAEAFATPLAAAGQGTLALIGSVAGDRGRQSNYIYGSAKGLVTRYAQGLQHRFAATPVKVVLIKPGPTDTPMTAQMAQAPGAMASPQQVAGDIVAGIARGTRVVYTPGKWALIMMVIRHLPFFIFSKMRI